MSGLLELKDPLGIDGPVLKPEPSVVEVQREHIAFLREMLTSRLEHWEDRVEALTKERGFLGQEVNQLKADNTRLRVNLAEILQYLEDLEEAYVEESPFARVDDGTKKRWHGLVGY